MALMDDGRGGIFCENSLVSPNTWGAKTQEEIREKTFDVVLTNPPFGKKLKIDETEILSLYDLGYKWKKNKNGKFEKSSMLVDAQPPQILFCEKASLGKGKVLTAVKGAEKEPACGSGCGQIRL